MATEIPELEAKFADNPMEKLILDTIENTETRIRQLELTLDLEKNALKYLKSKAAD